MRTEMRLSDAIMLGSSLLHHECAASVTTDHGCAIQMALAAIGVSESQRQSSWAEELKHAWPWVQQKFKYPGEHWLSKSNVILDSALHNIYTLNDIEEWSVEKIADWVRTVEPAPVEDIIPTTISQEVSVAAAR